MPDSYPTLISARFSQISKDKKIGLLAFIFFIVFDLLILGRISQGLVMMAGALTVTGIFANDVQWSKKGLALMVFNGMLDSFGNHVGYYGSWYSFDLFTHTLGAAAVVLFFFPYAQKYVAKNLQFNIFVNFLWAIFVVAVYEVGELAYESILGQRLIADRLDTSFDLAADFIGALLASWFLINWHERRKRKAKE